MKKLAIIWENSVSKWTVQLFEPLVNRFQVTLFVGDHNRYPTNTIQLPQKRLSQREEIFQGLFHPYQYVRQSFKYPGKHNDYYYNSLRKKLRGYDLVITIQKNRCLNTAASLKDELCFKAVTYWCDNIPFRSVFDKKTDMIKDDVLPKFDLIVAWTEHIKRSLLLEDIPASKLARVYNAVDRKLFYPSPKDPLLMNTYGLQETDRIILQVGKLASWKGAHYLIYAAKILKDRGESFKILLVGSGSQKENLKKLIQKAGLENHVLFPGFLPYEEVAKIFNLADVVVLSSIPTLNWQEQFGMVLIEAMACGKPIIASESGSIPEVVGDGGKLFSPGQFEQLADLLSEFIKNPEMCNSYGLKGLKRVKKYFDVEKNSQLFADLLDRL
ncbi:MAG: glycosyltransferase family 4 protein [bacterium]